MSQESKQREMLEEFRDYYGAAAAPAVEELERRVLGVGFGGNSYTTMDQARELVQLLELDDDTELLGIGSGAGWPGMFLARESDCRVVLTDIPLEGLVVAGARAGVEGIRARSVAASGAWLPFRDESFDAVAHSDVLC